MQLVQKRMMRKAIIAACMLCVLVVAAGIVAWPSATESASGPADTAALSRRIAVHDGCIWFVWYSLRRVPGSEILSRDSTVPNDEINGLLFRYGWRAVDYLDVDVVQVRWQGTYPLRCRYHIGIPLWFPIVLIGLFLLLGIVWERWRCHRKKQEGRCCSCGYALLGLTEPRCPECGMTFDPELLLPKSHGANQSDCGGAGFIIAAKEKQE